MHHYVDMSIRGETEYACFWIGNTLMTVVINTVINKASQEQKQ